MKSEDLEYDKPTRERVLQTVLLSEELSRSDRLREFLIFVCTRSWADAKLQIREQDIGVHVFGRPEGYDTGQDNIVRVTARQLRKRLATYYAGEGREEATVLLIPSGSYRPRIVSRVVSPSISPPVAKNRSELPIVPSSDTPENSSQTTPPTSQTNRSLRLFSSVVAPCFGVSLLFSMYLWKQNQSLKQKMSFGSSGATVSAFWANFTNDRRRTNVVLADPSFALIEDILHRADGLTGYLSGDYKRDLTITATDIGLQRAVTMIDYKKVVSVAEMNFAFKLLKLENVPSTMVLMYARTFTVAHMDSENTVFVGSKKSNPWIGLFTQRLNFQSDFDRDTGTEFIRNAHPLPGEQATYTSSGEQDGFAAIAFLPTQSVAPQTLILSGTGSESTQAAGEFLLSEDTLRTLVTCLNVKTLPYFEALIKVKRVNGVPIATHIVACRRFHEAP